MQNTEAIRDKSTTENKSQNLMEKVGSLEKENEGLDRQLSEVKDDATQAKTEAQSAQAKAQACNALNLRVEFFSSCLSPNSGVTPFLFSFPR
jgi:vacuolar-type H+-ATPase subunit D/Vma8